MSVRGQKFKLQGVVNNSVRVCGKFVGISGSVTTNITGSGFTLARASEGVYTVTFPAPLAGFVSHRAWPNISGSTSFQLVTTSGSVSSRAVTITHTSCLYASMSAGPVTMQDVGEIGFDVTFIEADTGNVTGI